MRGLLAGGTVATVKYPPLSDEQRAQLERVPASFDGVCEYRPCRVTLTSGETRDYVYVVDAERYIRIWGVWPSDDDAKESVSMADVVGIEDSPRRLPAVLANKIYEAGESGMGYVVFTVVLNDGRRLPYVTGNAVDFPSLPPGVTTDDVADVLPHEGRGEFVDRLPRDDEQTAPLRVVSVQQRVAHRGSDRAPPLGLDWVQTLGRAAEQTRRSALRSGTALRDAAGCGPLRTWGFSRGAGFEPATFGPQQTQASAAIRRLLLPSVVLNCQTAKRPKPPRPAAPAPPPTAAAPAAPASERPRPTGR